MNDPKDTIQARAQAKLREDLGPLLLDALADPRTLELMVNSDGTVWLEQIGQPMVPIGHMPAFQRQAVLETLAGYHGRTVTWEHPLLECELPLDGSRFAGELPPVVAAPAFCIRKPAVELYTLEHYVRDGILTPAQRNLLHQAVSDHRNLLVVGGTGSGKTTLLNALIDDMVQQGPHERVLILEDTREIRSAATNGEQLHTHPPYITMTDLLRITLRNRPDRILVGEVRGPEALDLLMSWNTGHSGAATVHANSARAGLDRLALLISMNPDAPRPIEPLIGASGLLLIHIAKTPTGREVRDLVEVLGWDRDWKTRTL